MDEFESHQNEYVVRYLFLEIEALCSSHYLSIYLFIYLSIYAEIWTQKDFRRSILKLNYDWHF